MKLPFYVCENYNKLTHDDTKCDRLWDVPWYNPFSGWHHWVRKDRLDTMGAGAYLPCSDCLNKDNRWQIIVDDKKLKKYVYLDWGADYKKLNILRYRNGVYEIESPYDVMWYMPYLIFDTKRKIAIHWNCLAKDELMEYFRKDNLIFGRDSYSKKKDD